MPVQNFVNSLSEALLNPLIILLSSLAVIIFVFGMARFVLQAEDEEGRKKGKELMIWGTTGLFIIFTVFGILELLKDIVPQ
ncbi:MAG: hypothetical protein OXU73_01850 [Candidatus Campbellbacteria bacterium]|nr:hypothetical protein [Candidatus Campbellbacteria bacterium]